MGKNEKPKQIPHVKLLNENMPSVEGPSKTGNVVVVTGGPTVVSNFGPEAQVVRCPYCHHFATTRVYNDATTKTHLFALVLCMCCCWLCSCCPYLIDSCQDRKHFCSHCKAYLGSYRC